MLPDIEIDTLYHEDVGPLCSPGAITYTYRITYIYYIYTTIGAPACSVANVPTFFSLILLGNIGIPRSTRGDKSMQEERRNDRGNAEPCNAGGAC